MVLDLCKELDIRSTFFFTANYAQEYPVQIEQMSFHGHEIGCHGLMHSDEEDYDRMPSDLQWKSIVEATQILQKVTNSPICSFRSPRVKTSAQTLKLLSDCGYLADSSVCSQRIDFISSNLINPGWLVAPRKPYRPHPMNAFKRAAYPSGKCPSLLRLFLSFPAQ